MGRTLLLLFSLALSARAAIGPEVLLTQTGAHAGDRLGLFVCDAGDLNADGRPDFVVGAPGARVTSVVAARSGSTSAARRLDAPDLMLHGEADGDQFGTSVRGCGDVNGDGWDDLVVGAPRNDAAFYNAGRVYVYFGGPAVDDRGRPGASTARPTTPSSATRWPVPATSTATATAT